MRLGLLACLLTAIVGCAPPPLEQPDPAIRITFPPTNVEGLTVCPSFVVVTEIDGFTLVPGDVDEAPDPARGHWHLYEGDVYQSSVSVNWTRHAVASTSFPMNLRIEARLAEVNHNETGVKATAEFMVDDAPGCVGGDPAGVQDTGDTADGV